MAKAADEACIQYRLLNRGKGPAVYSLRAQADRRRYQEVMKHRLELQENLRLIQAEIVEIGAEDDKVTHVKTNTGAIYECSAAVICSGTYLSGRTIVGDVTRDSGPDGMFAAASLGDQLKALGLDMRRFKTGTPPRVNRRSIDFSKMEIQLGDEEPEPFSFETDTPPENRAVCYLTYTTEETHRIIRENLHRSPLYSGVIEGVGPRYAPPSRTRWSGFRKSPGISFLWSPWELTPRRCTFRGFRRRCPRTCSSKCSIR
jgi:tRNA uridine 5-carboxymethylaminomethyl modification enzyme